MHPLSAPSHARCPSVPPAHSLGIAELTCVDIHRAELPHLTFFELEPCNSSWRELVDVVGIDSRTFIEEGLRR